MEFCDVADKEFKIAVLKKFNYKKTQFNEIRERGTWTRWDIYPRDRYYKKELILEGVEREKGRENLFKEIIVEQKPGERFGYPSS